MGRRVVMNCSGLWRVRRSAVAALVGCLLSIGLTDTALAKSATASGSVSILRSISLQKTTDLSFGRLQNPAKKVPAGNATVSAAPPVQRTGNGGVVLLPNGRESPAVYTISGEPGRAYRVSMPSSILASPGQLVANRFTVWTANKGQLSVTGQGQLDAAGVDTLRIGATLAVPGGTGQDKFVGSVPITISYE